MRITQISRKTSSGPFLDGWLIIAVLLLGLLGVLWVASASGSRATSIFAREYVRQLIWFSFGFIVIVVMQLKDYAWIARWAWPAYWASVLLLLLVLVPGIGAERYGARRWLDLGPVQFQPSELAKLATILALGSYLARPPQELKNRRVFLAALGMILIPAALIIMEPDLGSAIVLFPVGLLMMFVAGIPLIYLTRFLILGGLAALIVIVHVLWLPPQWKFLPIEPYQELRLLVYFGCPNIPENASVEEKRRLLAIYRDAAYNVEQALISVGSGGLWGKGYGKGQQNRLGYLPQAVAHNDFIFSVIAEESGFVGAAVLIGLYAIVLSRMVTIANFSRDMLGRLLAVGVAALWFSHVFINIGMNVRLVPVTGLPLPLVSYGGTSLLAFMAGIGLVLNIYRFRRNW